MSRLTKKENDIYTFTHADEDRQFVVYDLCEKLGVLEDLEQDLGCPLEVVFKAIKNGIDGYLKLILEYDEKDGWYFNAIWKYNDFGDYGNILYLKDYKKTWWLKEDLSE